MRRIYKQGLVTANSAEEAKAIAERIAVINVINVGAEGHAIHADVEPLPHHPMNGVNGEDAYGYKVIVEADPDAIKANVRNDRIGLTESIQTILRQPTERPAR